ncbi:MAG: DUF2129 domain-containing protein [Paracholeplasma sp.]|jgi:uncharacterized protein YlbG (UPF0298 family)|uniref:Uncharacterized protein n=1 Tax=Acholeplasma brassicae TaxID=61635 RepID=U4KPT3_9MOLU|nr:MULTISPECIES: DUF2129 domain-containing protein [Paracholeplasma]MDY3195397.1 DUF2129 domain-containing protein [Paracholeplasma sp.]CCV66381.1 hypothetical protein (UPF0298) [Paracholeplasma brassicae]
MRIDRISYIVYYKNKEAIKKVEQLDVNVTYNSTRLKFLTIYFDRANEKDIKRKLEQMKGIIRYEPSLLENQKIIFEV